MKIQPQSKAQMPVHREPAVAISEVPVGESFDLSGEVWMRVDPSAVQPGNTAPAAVNLMSGTVSVFDPLTQVQVAPYHVAPGA